MSRVAITDKLHPYGAAHREVIPTMEHRQSKHLNNRAENSHQPTRQRERAMKGSRSIGGAQRFLSAFSGISPHFRPRHRLMTAPDHRAEMSVLKGVNIPIRLLSWVFAVDGEAAVVTWCGTR
ncbi:hypothetical protein GCM10010390_53540 [Streptomyces mordarskii]|uniref:DDE domain-containing protein n=1 Tax=Streptomyces mordarskii TaxID=1226758 RepID=A0ABP3NKP3_9ACTN